MAFKSVKLNQSRWPGVMLNVTYICVGLALLLVAAQFWLYSVRYQRIFAKDTWQAVTLTNGQTYFGHLQQYGPHTLVLFNVYYLQASQSATTAGATTDLTTDASADSASTATDSGATTDSDLRLYKLTDDFHKPNDYLIINKDQVLFWQHLSPESPIVKTIAENS